LTETPGKIVNIGYLADMVNNVGEEATARALEMTLEELHKTIQENLEMYQKFSSIPPSSGAAEPDIVEIG